MGAFLSLILSSLEQMMVHFLTNFFTKKLIWNNIFMPILIILQHKNSNFLTLLQLVLLGFFMRISYKKRDLIFWIFFENNSYNKKQGLRPFQVPIKNKGLSLLVIIKSPIYNFPLCRRSQIGFLIFLKK